MGDGFALDTNVLAELERPTPNPAVTAWFERQQADRLFLTATVVAELWYGVELRPEGARRNALARWLEALLAGGFADRVLPFDVAAAQIWGRLMAEGRRAGRPPSRCQRRRDRRGRLGASRVLGSSSCGPVTGPGWRRGVETAERKSLTEAAGVSGCHTAILYGSRVRGDWDAASDIDVIAFRDAGEAGHVAHRWHDLYLDLFLYPTATKPAPDWVRLHGGRVLFQRGSDGDEVLSAVEGMLAAGPERLSADDARTRRLWAEKMLTRAEKGDPEGDYRRHWLLMALLEDYFALRGQWYLGPKRSLALLQREKPQDFAVLRQALEPSASIADIRAAVAMVIGVEDPPRRNAQP